MGKCVVIDPVRAITEYLEVIEEQDLEVVAIVETHVHADFVSGALELKEALHKRPKIYCSGMGGKKWTAQYADVVVDAQCEIIFGHIRLQAIHTPGHTPEHIMWALYDDQRSSKVPCLLFTGDFVFVGAIGRPDLLGEDEFKTLSHQLYQSTFHTLSQYPDFVEVYPTHSQGSMCGKKLGSRSSSTLGYERRFNESLLQETENKWIEKLMQGMPHSPEYFKRMKQINIQGPKIIGQKMKALPHFSAKEVKEMMRSSLLVIDTRSKEAFASLHIPGAISLPYGKNMSTWAATVLPYDTSMILVVEEAEKEHIQDIVNQLLVVGFDSIEGILEAGISSWEREGFKTETLGFMSVQELEKTLRKKEPLLIIDVRTKQEWEKGRIKEACHIPLDRISQEVLVSEKKKPIALICRTGYRASVAGSILQNMGYENVTNVLGGMAAWQKENFSIV